MTMPRLAARACSPGPQYHPDMGAVVPVPRICGREAEIGALGAALGHVAAGRPSIVLVEGEAGIGKTRLLAQVLADARGPRHAGGRGPGRGTGADPALRPAGRRLRVRPVSAGPATGGHRRLLAAPAAGDQGPLTVTSDPGLRFRVVDAFTDLSCREEGCPEITKRLAISGRWNAGVPLTAAPGSVSKPGGVTLVRAARPGWSAGPPAAGTPGSRCSCH